MKYDGRIEYFRLLFEIKKGNIIIKNGQHHVFIQAGRVNQQTIRYTFAALLYIIKDCLREISK